MAAETCLWLIRHAPVDGVKGTIHASEAPADLRDQAHLDAVRRCLPQDTVSYASPSRRTVDTARALKLDPFLMTEFKEQDFGDWTGRRHDDLAAAGGEGYARFWDDAARSRPPAGESFEDQIARVRQGLRRIETASAILVVHSGTIRAALSIALDLAPRAALRFVIHPLSVTRIDRLSDSWRIVSVNQKIL
jgi:alpha-ribazole phosphatase